MTVTASLPDTTHHTAAVNGTELHYVAAGDSGSPVLLVHGFPESWWAFRKVIPLLAATHRVFAVDLRGFGDSAVADDEFDSSVAADDLRELIEQLAVGPVHLVAQDIAGGAVFRLAASAPGALASFSAIEMGLAGFGLEGLGDVTHGGSWHIGVLAAPGIAELLFTGRERKLLGEWAFPSMTAVDGAVTDEDVAEFARGYARPGGWRGAVGLYRSMLAEGEQLQALARSNPLGVPVLAIDAGGSFTADTFAQVTAGELSRVGLDGVGHYAAQEAPEPVSRAVLRHIDAADAARHTPR